MPTSGELTDTYLAALLARDADNARMGISSGRKKPSDAPKPNLRFLRNIIRDTDTHNTALLAKERRLAAGALAGEKRRADPVQDVDEREAKSARRPRPDRWARALLEPESSRSTEQQGEHRKGKGRRERHGERSRESKEPRIDQREDCGKGRSRKSSHPRSQSPHRSSYQKRPLMSSRRSRSPSRSPARREQLEDRPSHARDRRDASKPAHGDTDSDSDPLERIVGPMPAPHVRARGRGATSGASGIDARFADHAHNPREDTQPSSTPSEDGDWDLALSAARERARWRAVGAERLRASGFSEADVKKWEGNSKFTGVDTDKDVQDVVWSKRGEGREWDRGKVLSEGEVAGTEVAWAKRVQL